MSTLFPYTTLFRSGIAVLGCARHAGGVTCSTGGFENLLAGFEYLGRVSVDQAESGNGLDALGNGFGRLGIGTGAHLGACSYQFDQQHNHDNWHDKGQDYGYDQLLGRFDKTFVLRDGLFEVLLRIVHNRILWVPSLRDRKMV